MSLRATFICGGELVPASRFRVHPVVESLRREGWAADLIQGYGPLDRKLSGSPLQRAYRAACRVRRTYRTATLAADGPVLVQRLAWPWWAYPEVRLASRCTGLVFDFDDAVFLGEGGRTSRSRRSALTNMFAASRHVVAGNSWLAQAVDAPVPVTVLPTCIDTRAYVPPSQPRDGRVVIGWIGSSGNFPYLAQIMEPLSELRRMGVLFDLRLCSDVEPEEFCRVTGANFERWSPQGEIPFLQSLDIGLMPLDDTDWCRGKCSFKLIQYMAVGCSVVASDVGMNRDVVEEGGSGYLVRGDWKDALADLILNRDRRQSMGLMARRMAVERFDVSKAVDCYRSILGALQ